MHGDTTVVGGYTWTVIPEVVDCRVPEMEARFAHPGLDGGLPVRDADVDLLKLWLRLYPGDIEQDLGRLNAAGLRRKATFRQVTPREWVQFWGLILASTQYHAKGKALWDAPPRRGVRDPPRFDSWMKFWRFDEIRQLVKYSKANLDRVPTDAWSMVRDLIEDFNRTRVAMIRQGCVQVLDESMSAYRPRKDKLGGLPNISYVMRKPKPLGTEFKCVCDASTGVMMHLDIQEGRDPMRAKPRAKELGVCTATTMRIGEACTNQGNIVVGDSWFGSVKVWCLCICLRMIQCICYVRLLKC